MSGGSGQGIVAKVAGMGQPETPAVRPGASFTPVTPNIYMPAFSSQQTGQAPTMQMAPAQQVQQAGLQALMANMMAQYQNVPGALAMQRQAPVQPMPQFRSQALSYRPNIQAVQQNLSRVKPSVYKTDLDAARDRIAELEARLQPSGE